VIIVILKRELPAPETIGHFAQTILTAIMMLGGEDYGVPI
jgi:hypothetical protein